MTRYAVLCGTSNEEEVINDPTGNRRIIPINVTNINWDAYEAIDKAALWMELYHAYHDDPNSWMLTSTDIQYLNEKTEQKLYDVAVADGWVSDEVRARFTARKSELGA